MPSASHDSFSFPAELLMMIPYLATIVGMVVYSVHCQRAEKARIARVRRQAEEEQKKSEGGVSANGN